MKPERLFWNGGGYFVIQGLWLGAILLHRTVRRFKGYFYLPYYFHLYLIPNTVLYFMLLLRTKIEVRSVKAYNFYYRL